MNGRSGKQERKKKKKRKEGTERKGTRKKACRTRTKVNVYTRGDFILRVHTRKYNRQVRDSWGRLVLGGSENKNSSVYKEETRGEGEAGREITRTRNNKITDVTQPTSHAL